MVNKLTIKEGEYFQLAGAEKKNEALQVMELWHNFMTVKTKLGCMNLRYCDAIKVENTSGFTLHKAPYFENNLEELFKIKIYFDGAVRESKLGTDMGLGIAVFVNGEYEESLSFCKGVKGGENSSSNVAEWMACVEAMKFAAECKGEADVVQVYSDSQITAYQFNGDYAINKEHFKQYYQAAKEFSQVANVPVVRWIRRELNKEADKLSKKGLLLINSGEN